MPAARGGCSPRAAPTPSWAAAATSPAPPASRRCAAAAAGADRGRQPPRARQPPAGPPGPARLPRVPDPGPRGGALPGHRPPRPGRDARGRPRRGRRALRDRRRRSAACWSSAAASARARSTRRARRLRGDGPPAERDFHVLHIAGSRDYPRPRERLEAAGAPSATRCSSTSPTSATRSPPPTWCSRAPAARCSSWPRPGRPAILVPYPHATARHQHANAAWMAEAGAAIVIEDAELTRGAARRRWPSCSPTRERLERDGGGLARARPPRRRASGSRPRSSAPLER